MRTLADWTGAQVRAGVRRMLLLALALAAATSGSAWAMNWTRLVETQTMTFYVNRNAIEKDGDIRRIWEMQDLKAADPEGVRSRQYVNEYDCKHRMHRIGRMTSFAGPMLTGQKLFDVEEFGYWRKIPPASLFEKGFVLHCGAQPWQPGEEKKAPWWAPFWPFGNN